ncbi:hypothetical protein NN561_002237 [Cricetulus griseus]
MGPPAAWPAANWGACSLRRPCSCALAWTWSQPEIPKLDTHTGHRQVPSSWHPCGPWSLCRAKIRPGPWHPGLRWGTQLQTLLDSDPDLDSGPCPGRRSDLDIDTDPVGTPDSIHIHTDTRFRPSPRTRATDLDLVPAGQTHECPATRLICSPSIQAVPSLTNTQSWLTAPLKGTLSAMIEVASYPGGAADSHCQGSGAGFLNTIILGHAS